jgi:hypothetical protein
MTFTAYVTPANLLFELLLKSLSLDFEQVLKRFFTLKEHSKAACDIQRKFIDC